MRFDLTTIAGGLVRPLLIALTALVALVVWNGNMTAIEIKDFIVQVTLIPLGVLALLSVFNRKQVVIDRQPILLFTALFAIMLLLAYLGTTRSSVALKAIIPPLYSIIAFFLIVRYFDRERIEHLIIALLLTAAIASLYGILQFLRIDPLHWQVDGERFLVNSFFGHKNFFGNFLLLLIPLGVGYGLMSTRHVSRILAVVATGLMMLALALSNSRGAFIGFFFSTLLFVLMVFLRNRKSGVGRVVVVMMLVPLLCVVVLALMPSSIRNDFLRLTGKGDWEERFSHYSAASEIISGKPWFGIGPGNFVIAYPQNRVNKLMTNDPNLVLNHVHNDFLELWAEYGIFTLIMYCSILVMFFRLLWIRFRKAGEGRDQMMIAAILVGIAGYLLYSFFTISMTNMTSSFYFWVVAGIGYVLAVEPGRKPLSIVNKWYSIPLLKSAVSCLCVVAGILLMGLTINRYRSDITLKQAFIAASTGHFAPALASLDKAIALNPKSAEAHYQKGYVLFSTHVPAKALEEYGVVNDLVPWYVNTAFNMASCQYALQNWPAALSTARICEERFPAYQPAIVLIAYCYYYLGQPQQAERYCDRVISLDPTYGKIMQLKQKLQTILSGQTS